VKKIKKVRWCRVVEAALGNTPGNWTFLELSPPHDQESGILEQMSEWKRGLVQDYVKSGKCTAKYLKLNILRMDTIFNEYGIKKIDLLSLDIEGSELSALRSIDWDAVTIDVIISEKKS